MRGFAAIGVWHPKTEVNIGTLWRSALIYDAALVFTVGRRYMHQASDTVNAPRHIPLMHYLDLESLLAHLPHGCPLVGVEQGARARDLAGYGHPERAAYILGAEDHGLPVHVQERCHSLIQIGTPQPHCMNVAVAGSIVLYDRHAKGVERRYVLP